MFKPRASQQKFQFNLPTRSFLFASKSPYLPTYLLSAAPIFSLQYQFNSDPINFPLQNIPSDPYTQPQTTTDTIKLQNSHILPENDQNSVKESPIYSKYRSLLSYIRRNLRAFLIWVSPRTLSQWGDCIRDLIKSSLVLCSSFAAIFGFFLLWSGFHASNAANATWKLAQKAKFSFYSIPVLFGVTMTNLAYNKFRASLDEDHV